MKRQWWGPPGWMAWPGFPFAQSARFFEAGEVRLAILSLLAEAPRNGYQLIKELQERSGGLYRASAGSVYPTLQQLEDEGLVELKPRDGKRIYELTEAGRAELARDPEAVRRIWERAERWEGWGQCLSPGTVAVLGAAIAVLKATMQAAKRAAGDRQREQQVLEILERARREIEELAAQTSGTARSKTEKRPEENERSPWFL